MIDTKSRVESYILAAYDGIDADETRTIKINQGPEVYLPKVSKMPSGFKTTFGERVHSLYLPGYFDPENDPLQINIRDYDNPFLGFYTVPFGEELEVEDVKVQYQEVRSDILIEG